MLGKQKNEYLPFRPALEGPFATRFHRAFHKLIQSQDDAHVRQVCIEEVAWAVNEAAINPNQRRVYRATWLLLRDLATSGWQLRWHAGNAEISAPYHPPQAQTHKEIQQAKEWVRRAMRTTRLERINESAEFIQRMEDPPKGGVVKAPITALIANGKALVESLTRAINTTDEVDQANAIRQAIRPYLVLVNDKARCPYTGHKLSDIWRYFRFIWTSVAESTPGRSLQYLIRDAAQPDHSIIGITALENSALGVSDRDKHLGWTVAAVADDFKQIKPGDHKAARALMNRLLKYVARGVNEVDLKGLCTAEECAQPTDELFHRLSDIVAQSEMVRTDALRFDAQRKFDALNGITYFGEADDDEDAHDESYITRSELGNINKAAEEALYRRKRAHQLLRLLTARQRLQCVLAQKDIYQATQTFLETEGGKSAVQNALIAVKNQHVGTSILELNVCGAIPPYNQLLGGKLTALLMLSPEVVADYRQRYGRRASDIASRMKGKAVIRPAEIVYLGTTSLYQVSSSQYNRLKLPAGLVGKDKPEVRWQHIGKTSGYGSLHIGRNTMRALDEVCNTQEGHVHINHVFGEGASPKLRGIRQGVTAILRDHQSDIVNALTRHSMPRLIYGAWLAQNGRAYVRGDATKPDYYFDDAIEPLAATQQIAEYWRRRWLSSRLQYDGLLASVAKFDARDLLVSKDLTDKTSEFAKFVPIVEEKQSREALVATKRNADAPIKGDDIRDFIRDLYRGSSAYADSTQNSWLSQIHIPTKLEDEVLDAVKAGKSVVLTGSPGDGKTHLLRMLQPRLQKLAKKPVVELDASAITSAELLKRWQAAAKRHESFCVAINAAVLKSLADEAQKFDQIQEAQRQVETAVAYDDTNEQVVSSRVMVFDLSRRNVLAPDVVAQALSKLSDSNLVQRCARCSGAGCDFVHNQMLLAEQQVQQRLQFILDRISRRGYHATLRELMSFIAYLLFAGRSCDELIAKSGTNEYALPQLPFKGKGALFDRVRASFDPAAISHLTWDEQLLAGLSQGWLATSHREDGAIELDNLPAFQARKRAFYFFHERGAVLQEMATDDESEFARFLQSPPMDQLKEVVRLVNVFFRETDNRDLRVWQSYRYNQAPRAILYSTHVIRRTDLEVATPRLRYGMAEAFDYTVDHVVLRRKKPSDRAALRVDFDLYELLRRCERGWPMLSVDTELTRRLWQFMEQLVSSNQDAEVEVIVLDPTSGDKLKVTLDTHARRYVEARRIAMP